MELSSLPSDSDIPHKALLRSLLVISLTAVLLWFLLTSVDLRSTFSTLRTVSLSHLVVSVILMACIMGLKARRWQHILSGMEYRIPLRRCFVAEMAALPVLAVTPSKTGEAAKALYIRDSVRMQDTIASVVFARLFDVGWLACFGALGFAALLRQRGAWETGSVLLLAVIAGFAVLLLAHRFGLLKFIRRKLPENRMEGLFHDSRVSVVTATYSLAIFAAMLLQVALFFDSIAVTVPPFAIYAYVPLAVVVGLLPVTLSGVGTRDTAFIVLFAEYASSGQLLVVGVLYTLVRYLIPALLGLPFLVREGWPE